MYIYIKNDDEMFWEGEERGCLFSVGYELIFLIKFGYERKKYFWVLLIFLIFFIIKMIFDKIS